MKLGLQALLVERDRAELALKEISSPARGR
jgi:hypothetical protein